MKNLLMDESTCTLILFTSSTVIDRKQIHPCQTPTLGDSLRSCIEYP